MGVDRDTVEACAHCMRMSDAFDGNKTIMGCLVNKQASEGDLGGDFFFKKTLL